MKVGIYGGSFDPVHYGHVNIAKTAVADLGLDRLVVVPAAVSPFKTDAGPGSGPWQRVEMVKAAFADVPNAVVDSFEGGAVRPVNTLSGGEQFLVSLALALGLAGMNDTGLGVDMLLIDEGFGTLSGEHLNSAIEALERLNAITGSRKVGVISHVERLRERIPTHIEVTRRGHDPSEVRVVVNGHGQ